MEAYGRLFPYLLARQVNEEEGEIILRDCAQDSLLIVVSSPINYLHVLGNVFYEVGRYWGSWVRGNISDGVSREGTSEDVRSCEVRGVHDIRQPLVRYG